ncbi:arylsulfatase [Verrucomicrobiota bacterium]
MKRREFLISTSLAASGIFTIGMASKNNTVQKNGLAGARPNIVLIMPDDISFGAISAYGGNSSPNVDILYKNGLRFESFHVSPTCSPTRAALMTGRHECYAGVTHTIKMRDRLSLKSRTVANMLSDSGYATGIFGKWHLGDEKEYRPDSRGFDEAYIHGAGGIAQNYPHSADFPNNDYNNPVLYHNGKAIETKGFCTDLFFDQAIRWIGNQKTADKPFFAYIPLNVNHGPHIPPILPDGSRGNTMENLDDNVGKMMTFLDQEGLSENTLLIYMTDNGSPFSGNKKLRGGKGTPYEGGIRVPCIMYWKGKVEGGKDCHKLTGHIDFYSTFAELAGSSEPVPGGKIWDGRSMVPLMENPEADWKPRYWIAHRTRWGNAESSKYGNCSIQDSQYKLAMSGNKQELFDLTQDLSETTNIADKHPDIVKKLNEVYDSWWEDIQPYMVNDHIENVPKENKPYHELYRQAFGEEKFQEAMRLMTWNGGKRYNTKNKKK